MYVNATYRRSHFITMNKRVSDLLETSLVGYPLEGLFFGGSAAPELLALQAQAAFPTARL